MHSLMGGFHTKNQPDPGHAAPGARPKGMGKVSHLAPHPPASSEEDVSAISQYFRDLRGFPLLTREREIALAQQLQEGRDAWRDKILHHLLHIPLVLACRARLRRQSMSVSDIWESTHLPPFSEVLTTLDHLQRLRCHMRRYMRGGAGVGSGSDLLLKMHEWRTEIRLLIASWPCQPTFLHQAWRRFDTAMATTSAARQLRQMRRYITTLGYNLGELRVLWCSLHHLYTDAERAKQEMVTRNLRLVVSVAREFVHSGLPLTDLIQEGNIGLIRAVDKFDHRRNLKFSTYAIWWIKQAMRRAVFDQSALVRVPEYMVDSVRLVYKTQQTLSLELGRPPTLQELAQHLAMPVVRVERSLALVREQVSLDRPLGNDTSQTLSDILPDAQTVDVQDGLMQQALVDHTQRALERLTPRQAEIIRRRFGLHGKPGETLRQIGDNLHLSHERVRQIEAEALTKLRQTSTTLQAFLES
ncbi:RNA polymerase sigma factor RpoD [Candidatus Entotheonellaceae bacterium PAL068K]